MKFLLVVVSCLVVVANAKHSYIPIAYNTALPQGYGYSFSTHQAPPSIVYSLHNLYNYQTPYLAPPSYATQKTQYHAQDGLGQAVYGHSEPLQAHNAVQDAYGNKIGSFSYVGPEGQVFSTNYVADALGYRANTNALPVEDADVAAARRAHLQEVEAVKSRSKRSVYSTPYVYHSTPYVYHSTPYVYHSTPHVYHHTPVVTKSYTSRYIGSPHYSYGHY